MTKEKWHRFSCVRCEIDFYCKFQLWKKQMAIVRMMKSVFGKWTNLFLILFRSTFRWTAYSVGIALSALHVTLSLDTFLKIIGITRIIQHYST